MKGTSPVSEECSSRAGQTRRSCARDRRMVLGLYIQVEVDGSDQVDQMQGDALATRSRLGACLMHDLPVLVVLSVIVATSLSCGSLGARETPTPAPTPTPAWERSLIGWPSLVVWYSNGGSNQEDARRALEAKFAEGWEVERVEKSARTGDNNLYMLRRDRAAPFAWERHIIPDEALNYFLQIVYEIERSDILPAYREHDSPKLVNGQLVFTTEKVDETSRRHVVRRRLPSR